MERHHKQSSSLHTRPPRRGAALHPHCYLGARSFEITPVHLTIVDSLKSDGVSYATSGSLNIVQNVGALNELKFWTPAQ